MARWTLLGDLRGAGLLILIYLWQYYVYLCQLCFKHIIIILVLGLIEILFDCDVKKKPIVQF